MTQLYGLQEALINLHNEKMMAIADQEVFIRFLSKRKPEEIVAKIPLKSSVAGTGYQSVTAEQLIRQKQAELDNEYKILAVMKEMIQEGELGSSGL